MSASRVGQGIGEDVRNRLVFGAHWGFVAFFAGLGGYHLVTVVMTALRSGQASVDPLELLDVGPVLLLAFVPSLLLGLAPLVASRRWGRGPRRDFGWLPTLRDVKVGLACGALALLAGYLVNLVLLGIYGTDRVSDSPLTDLAEDGGRDEFVWLALAALVVVVATPMAEELLMRGSLWGALEHHRVPQWVILVLTAVVFAYLHGEPTRTLALLAQGLVIGAARWRTGRVGASFVAHAANNLAPALLLFTGS
ncbi:CPBP family intramembrane glutamic endopeptidase [Amycolatopsis tucumanensis]|uniref:CPBP family intramembrane glutamic endopeptidase n=1 Tax=Amycolatopsis tucumanensis TaxID=401106 RepID=UPI001F1F8D5E|nr:type II CAAX endopeptidase family protein [Amycolatopsis tucumanensis]MCF6423202.1 CPBP family intramembrane metalloprotease [Amycolatopsis tucumanensis]